MKRVFVDTPVLLERIKALLPTRRRRTPGLRALKTTALSVPLLSALCIAQGAAQPSGNILTYHADGARSGAYVVAGLDWQRARGVHLDGNFHAHIEGHVYAQPLYWQESARPAQLLIATESDTVYALDAISGRTQWRSTLGQPVPLSSMPCGNIDPLGITGTPVIDLAHRAVYLDAMRLAPGGEPAHALFALSLDSGSVLAGWPIDVASHLPSAADRFIPSNQNQRGALALLNDTLYVPFGGNFGDCGIYHGWVVGVSLSAPHVVTSWHTAARGGGIWAPGGVVTDGGALLVATGNTMDAHGWGDGEAVVRLDAHLNFSGSPADFFAPANWQALDERDADLGSVAPLPFNLGGSELLVTLGKDANAYLLDRGHLGGIGKPRLTQRVAERAIRTAPAMYRIGPDLYIAFQASGANCPHGGSGLTVLRLRPAARSFETAWCGTVQGSGAPIVTTTDGHEQPVVWILGAEGDERLYGFRADTGERLYMSQRLAGLRHFQTLIAAGNHLYVTADDNVFAFTF